MAEIIKIRVGDATFRVRGGLRGKFWKSMSSGQWEHETIAAITSQVGPESTFIDIGSWVGPTALIAASLGAKTFCFEPDPAAFAELEANLRLNGKLKVQAHNYGLGRERGTYSLTSKALGNSMSTLVKVRSSGRVKTSVEVREFDAELRPILRMSNSAFVKVDIEGGEISIARNLHRLVRQRGCSLLLSTHYEALRRWSRPSKPVQEPQTAETAFWKISNIAMIITSRLIWKIKLFGLQARFIELMVGFLDQEIRIWSGEAWEKVSGARAAALAMRRNSTFLLLPTRRIQTRSTTTGK